MGNLLTIGVFSDASHLSIKALRRYHDLGLLVPASVDERTGYRGYSVAQLTDAEVIRRLRQLDVPLEEIRRVVEARDPAVTAAVLAGHRTRMQDRLAEAERIVTDLQQLLDEPEVLHRVLVHERRQRPEPIVCLRTVLPMAEVPVFFADAYPRLLVHLARHGQVPSGPLGARYGDGEGIDHDGGPVEAFVPCATAVPGAGDVVADHLPDTALAVALHVGSYDGMVDTYRSVGVWVTEQDRRVTGSLQELYLLGPGDVPDPRSFRTEVGWPVSDPVEP